MLYLRLPFSSSDQPLYNPLCPPDRKDGAILRRAKPLNSPSIDMTPRIRQHTVRGPSQRRPHTQLVPHGAAYDE